MVKFKCKNIRKIIAVVKNLLVYFVNFFKYGIMGNSVRIEASSLCQLKCPLCPNTKGDTKKVIGHGYLKFSNFKKFVDENRWIKNIELSNWGEIFLNPELKDIIKYGYVKKVNLTAFNGVNLNTASEDVLEDLVKYKFKLISVSIDGCSNGTYSIYRKGGDFNRVISNVEKINYYKRRHGSAFPYLVWQFVIFGHNEHEINEARRRAGELNMSFNVVFNALSDTYSSIKNKELVYKETGVSSIEEHKNKFGVIYDRHCLQLWSAPQINWDGKLLGCCVNQWGDYGNVF